MLVLGSKEAAEEWLPDAQQADPEAKFVLATHVLDVKGVKSRTTEVVLIDGWVDLKPDVVKAAMRVVGRRFSMLAMSIAPELQRPVPVVRSMLDEEFRVWRNTAAALQAVLMRKGEA